jgi:O-glycosyl hydrolase
MSQVLSGLILIVLIGMVTASLTGLAAADPESVHLRAKINSTQQTIDGFGFSTAWGSVPDVNNPVVMDAFFSVSKGAGLSILRNRIPFRENPTANDHFLGDDNYASTRVDNGSFSYKNFSLNWSNWDLSATRTLIAAVKAKGPDYQVTKIFSTPWSPPNNKTSRWKLPSPETKLDYSTTPEVGGYLDPNHYQDYADVLADYVLQFDDPAKGNMGMPLTALSLQNEPNFRCNYESCDWSARQFHDFYVVMKAEFTKKGVFKALPGLQGITPEDSNFKEDLVLPTFEDPDTADMVQIVGAHQYEVGAKNMKPESASYAPPVFRRTSGLGKKIWMTEWSTTAFAKWSEIDQALILGQLIQQDFTITHVNAYIYWWTAALMDPPGVPNKKLYVLGQFSRFIRPGWKMVSLSESEPRPSLFTSSYIDPEGKNLVFVTVNRCAKDFVVNLSLDTGSFGSGTIVRTSETENMAPVSTFQGGTECFIAVPKSSVVTLAVALKR